MALRKDVAQALLATLAVTGATLDELGIMAMASQLQDYPPDLVLQALQACQRECKHRLTLADVIERINSMDGHPSPDEAWAMVPKDEDTSAAVTDQMMRAWHIASAAWLDGDKYGARMAFLTAYKAELEAARRAGQPAEWWASLGFRRDGRAEAIREARRRNEETMTYALHGRHPQQAIKGVEEDEEHIDQS